uniref:Uncharacterized protein n=1 Tax=Romanomermis culicivorax TaxID=13658 RepID=A0A915IFJ1_ROMCU
MDATARNMKTRPLSNHMAVDLHRRSPGIWHIMGRGRDRPIELNPVEDTRRPMCQTGEEEPSLSLRLRLKLFVNYGHYANLWPAVLGSNILY